MTRDLRWFGEAEPGPAIAASLRAAAGAGGAKKNGLGKGDFTRWWGI